MEWEGMHRPLQPPPGFERFHSEEAVFPGLHPKMKKKQSLQDYLDTLKRAWKLYLHSYRYDPDMAEIERKVVERESMIIQRKTKAFLDRSKSNFKLNQQAVQETSERVVQEIHDRRPEAEALIKDRVNVLREALTEFADGYNEGVEGRFNFFKDSEDDNDYPHEAVNEDNKPVIYNNEKI
ncbi:unnamed protein product [Agarophyton chilense]